MLITFYGVRGSLPAPGPATARYGGNTSCVHARLRDGRDFIFDAGSGLREAGYRLARSSSAIVLMCTHAHWDHIQGFPFFNPIFEPERDIAVLRTVPPHRDLVYAGVLEQMNGHNHPVVASTLPAHVRYEDDIDTFLAPGEARVSRQTLNHDGGGSAFRLTSEGASIAYVTDNELDPPGAPATTYDQWVAFCRGAHVLVHDAQYTEADMPHKHGWGHSLISQVRELAWDAEVDCLVLFHHDPQRCDNELDQVRLESEHYFRKRGARTQVLIAFEGLALDINPGAQPGSRVTAVSASHP